MQFIQFCGQLPGQSDNFFHLSIAATGIMVRENQVTHFGLVRQSHRLLKSGVPPAPPRRHFRRQILRIVDQQVALPAKFHEFRQAFEVMLSGGTI